MVSSFVVYDKGLQKAGSWQGADGTLPPAWTRAAARAMPSSLAMKKAKFIFREKFGIFIFIG